jgi:hypothetical protein
MDEHDPGTGIARRHGLVESRMRGDTHVRFGGAGRGTRSSEKGDTAPRPDPYKAGPAGGRLRRPSSAAIPAGGMCSVEPPAPLCSWRLTYEHWEERAA